MQASTYIQSEFQPLVLTLYTEYPCWSRSRHLQMLASNTLSICHISSYLSRFLPLSNLSSDAFTWLSCPVFCPPSFHLNHWVLLSSQSKSLGPPTSVSVTGSQLFFIASFLSVSSRALVSVFLSVCLTGLNHSPQLHFLYLFPIPTASDSLP